MKRSQKQNTQNRSLKRRNYNNISHHFFAFFNFSVFLDIKLRRYFRDTLYVSFRPLAVIDHWTGRFWATWRPRPKHNMLTKCVARDHIWQLPTSLSFSCLSLSRYTTRCQKFIHNIAWMTRRERERLWVWFSMHETNFELIGHKF